MRVPVLTLPHGVSPAEAEAISERFKDALRFGHPIILTGGASVQWVEQGFALGAAARMLALEGVGL